MPKFRVWDPEQMSEEQLITKGQKWSAYDAEDSECAALALAEEMAYSGDFPDHFAGDTFDLHVRDIQTSELSVYVIDCDWEPRPFICKKREAI